MAAEHGAGETSPKTSSLEDEKRVPWRSRVAVQLYLSPPDETRYHRIQEYRMRPDKTPQDTGVSDLTRYNRIQEYQMRPDKIPQYTGVLDVDPETGLSRRKNQTS
ncbi:hypothetical protein Bbelb_153920 [Branchiostoma belcheri]|nr:hypothetical protein Bbelb_153920 [Branchiostoma belcheri]